MDRTELTATTTEVIGPNLARLQTGALGMGVIGAVLTVGGFLMGGGLKGIAPAYLHAFWFWFGITAGCLGFLMLHHVVGGAWGFILRRFLEAGARLWWLPVVFFLPIATLFMGDLYSWTHPEAAQTPVVKDKLAYLNAPFFWARAAVYFMFMWLWSTRLVGMGARFDEDGDERTFGALNRWSAFGILLMVLMVTFSAVDWIMSIKPEWMSSIIGLLMTASHALSTLSLMLVLVACLGGDKPLVRGIPGGYFRDLGNLLLALVMLWAYTSFSQFLITYSGNQVEEVTWYVERARNGWGIISLLLIPAHFALPFLVLLVGSEMKKDPMKLFPIAAFILVMRWMDLWWWVAPTFRSGLSLNLADLGLPLLMGGIWLFLWAANVKDRKVVPIHDPRLQEHLHEVVAHG